MNAKATKLTTDKYAYRGFTLEREDYIGTDGQTCQGWQLSPMTYLHRCATTLRTAKALVDDIYSSWHELNDEDRLLVVCHVRQTRDDRKR